MALRGEGRLLHACVIVRTNVHTIHTAGSVFSFHHVHCHSIKDCLELAILEFFKFFSGKSEKYQGIMFS